MKQIALGLLFALSSALTYAETSIVGRLVQVIDGDTMTMRGPRNVTLRVSLAGIDAPERGQPYALDSRRSLISLCAGQPIAVYEGQRNRHGHLFGHVYCAGVDVAAEQVKRGMAWAQDNTVASWSGVNLAEQQRAARGANLGLWADPAPVSPWDFRKRRGQR